MKFDASFFDVPVQRWGTDCIKWDDMESRDLIPMWVADMDLRCPPAVTEALARRVEHGIFGYTKDTAADRAAVADFMAARHNWKVDPDSMVWSPSVLSTLKVAIQIFTKPGDGIIVQPPVYPPFLAIPGDLGRELVLNPLKKTDAGWRMDLEDLENCLKKGAKAMMLCSPHNPVGRVWTKEELQDVIALFRKYNAKLIVDEIHHDLIMPGHTQTSIMTLGVEDMAITGVSTTKTFNLAGLEFSTAVVPDPDLRRQFTAAMYQYGSQSGNLLARLAQRTAYQEGGAWLDGLLAYLAQSKTILEDSIRRDFPDVTVSDIQGTYLGWLDFGAYTQDPDKLIRWSLDAGVCTQSGAGFRGPQCLRINLACPHSQLIRSLELLRDALPKLRG